MAPIRAWKQLCDKTVFGRALQRPAPAGANEAFALRISCQYLHHSCSMKFRRMLPLFSFVLIAAGFAPAESNAAERYALDGTHSNVLFKVRHNDISYVFGRFNDFNADIQWDEQNPANSRVSFTIKAESVDTHNDRRDQHLRSPDFFNARQFPEVAFTSREVKKNADNTFAVSGELTLLGQRKPVSFTWTETGAGPGPRGDFRRGGIATFTIKRSEFGMNYMLDRLSDEVELIISLQSIRQ
jgi:polyisoprenoid-binding protein YceI